jgi:uncharacterized cysteine cluster protein YcgN (CxxCxxCC family)
MVSNELPFWKRKSLEEMTPDEWESLCDGCAWCCVYRLEDEETGQIYTTQVACKLLDLKTCRCRHYPQRHRLIQTCVQITPDLARSLSWLPETCAYRRVAEGKNLPEWHHLITGDRRSIHLAGASALGKVFSEIGIDLDDLQDYLPDEDQTPC